MTRFSSTGTLCVVAAAVLASSQVTEALIFKKKGGDELCGTKGLPVCKDLTDRLYECDFGFIGQDGICVPYQDKTPAAPSGPCGMGGQPVCTDLSDREYECDFGYVGEDGVCVEYMGSHESDSEASDTVDADCGKVHKPVCTGDMMAGREYECDHGLVGKSGLCVPYTLYTAKTGNVEPDTKDADDKEDKDVDVSATEAPVEAPIEVPAEAPVEAPVDNVEPKSRAARRKARKAKGEDDKEDEDVEVMATGAPVEAPVEAPIETDGDGDRDGDEEAVAAEEPAVEAVDPAVAPAPVEVGDGGDSDGGNVDPTITLDTESGETLSSATGRASAEGSGDGVISVDAVGNAQGVASANGEDVLVFGRKLTSLRH